jgi:endo-1,4-beta-D-glucanase Y
MGWGGGNGWCSDTSTMINSFRNSGYRSVDPIYVWSSASVSQARVFFENNKHLMVSGDLLYRERTSGKSGHVVFFDHWEGNRLIVFAASSKTSSPQVGMTSLSFETFVTTYNLVVRPKPFGSDSYGALVNGQSFVGTAF